MSPIRVVPIGFESLGVRSMCTFIQTPDIRILIDAGVALGPRFGKPPHPKEYEARQICRSRIREYASKSDIIIVSHCHNDHHTPNYADTIWLGSSREESEAIYRNKIVIAKDTRNSVNFSQRRRGWMFLKFIEELGSKFQIGDGSTFEYGGTKIECSQPVPHGEDDTNLGWVIMTTVESGGERIMHTSDVQGPMSSQTLKMILSQSLSLIILGGPPTYLGGIKVNNDLIKKAILNASKIASTVPVVLLEHHVLRSEGWREETKVVYEAGSEVDHKICSAAEYLGASPHLLESMRPRLHEIEPPSESFMKWYKLSRDKRSQTPPPL